MSAGGDEAFCAEAADLLAALPGVRAVALGGSRASGTAGLRGVDDILTGLSAEPACLLDAVDRAAVLLG